MWCMIPRGNWFWGCRCGEVVRFWRGFGFVVSVFRSVVMIRLLWCDVCGVIYAMVCGGGFVVCLGSWDCGNYQKNGGVS